MGLKFLKKKKKTSLSRSVQVIQSASFYRPRNTLYLASSAAAPAAKESNDGAGGEGVGGVSVDATVLLSSQLRRPHADVPLLNPVIFSREERGGGGGGRGGLAGACAEAESGGSNGGEEDFGILLPLLDADDAGGGEDLVLVAHNESAFHIIKPRRPGMVFLEGWGRRRRRGGKWWEDDDARM